MPPADSGGEYSWLHSETHTLLKSSIEKLKKSYVGADTLGDARVSLWDCVCVYV